MWCVVLLACGIWSNCWAMDESDIITVYKDKPVADNNRNLPNNRDILFNLAKEYHEELLSVAEKRDETNIYARCLAYLKAHENTVALAISNTGNVIVHGFENKLVAIDYVNKQPVEIIEPVALGGKELDPALTFVACSVRWVLDLPFNPLNHSWHYIAVDNARRIHEWYRRPGSVRAYYSDDWKNTVPGTVTAIRDRDDKAPAIFYRDDQDDTDRVGFMLEYKYLEKKIGKNTFMPIQDAKDVTHVKSTGYLDHYYRIFSADGSSVLYKKPWHKDDEMTRQSESSCVIQ